LNPGNDIKYIEEIKKISKIFVKERERLIKKGVLKE